MYNLINWQENDDITADRLNAMDNGIKNANDRLEEKVNTEELKNYIPVSEKGVTVATLEDGKVPISQLPEISGGSGSIITDYIKSISSNGTDTLTITKGNESTEQIKINNTEQAIKAEQDGDGNIIKNTYLNMQTGIYSGNYLISQNDLRIKSGSNNTSSGSGISINRGAFRIYDWSISKGIMFFNNGDGYAQTNTPNSDDNSFKIATTGFVKAQTAGMDISLLSILNQYYKKDSSGLIHQFVELEATAEEIDVQFPISFPEKCLFVGVEILNPQKDSSSNVKFETIEKALDSVKLLKIGTGTPTISVMAIGI